MTAKAALPQPPRAPTTATPPKTSPARANPQPDAGGATSSRPQPHFPKPSPAAARVSGAQFAAVQLLKLESEMRQVRTPAELAYFMANETRLLTNAQQVAVFSASRRNRQTVSAVSAVAQIDRTSPLVLWFEDLVAALSEGHGLAEPRELDAGAFPTSQPQMRDSYPLRHLLWIPLLDPDGKVIGGLLQARAKPWSEHDIAITRHLAGACAHTSLALRGSESIYGRPLGLLKPRPLFLIAVLMGLMFLTPIPMSALAPVEVAPRDPFIVTAGVDGVIESVLVEPNAPVKKGEPLVRMADTVLKNRFEIAEREVLVAEAKYKKASQLAFVDMRGRHDLALAGAELELKTAERDFARDLLARSVITAGQDGVAVYSDKNELIGRSVAVGEKLMEIADPAATEFRIDLPVSDAIVLSERARVKVFLDADPLNPIETQLVRADFRARPRSGDVVAFRLVAAGPEGEAKINRLGVRGTAQIYGTQVTLGFYLFRRPISAARQWLGL